MATTLISKKTQKGQSLEITFDGSQYVATLDGVELAQSWMPGTYVAAKQLHVFAGKVGLSKAEGEVLLAAEKSAADARRNATPAPASRADLVAEYRGWIDEQAAAYERAHDRQDANAMHIKMSFDAKIEAAAEAIKAYDTAHPEETAQREADRAASVERNRWK
jgi:hypothetical protein